MYRDHTVGVVVPAYDEAGLVGNVLCDVPAFVDRVYAVDDCSNDGTWEEIRRVAEHESEGTAPEAAPTVVRRSEDARARALEDRVAVRRRRGRIDAIRHADNRGAGGAIKTGYLAALEDGVDVVATIDGDGQMDPALLPRFLDPLVEGEADYAKGNRLRSEGVRERMPTVRLVGNVVLTLLTKVASGYWAVGDSQNGYTAVTASALRRLDVETLFEYYGYCNEVLVRLGTREMRVRDVTMPPTYGDEQSHIDYAAYVPRVSRMLLRNFLWRLRATRLDPPDASDGDDADREPSVRPFRRAVASAASLVARLAEVGSSRS